MASRRLLYLTAHQLGAYRWNAGRIEEEASFEVADAAEAFVAYLRQHRDSLFALLINVAEEGFQVDTIPFLQSGDRRVVIARKLNQLFPGAPLTATLSLGFEKTRRKDERLLFTALNNGSLIDPWLLALRAAEARLVGIYSLPLLARTLIDRLHLAKERCLLVTVQDTSIRQTFFDRGLLHFSRLSPLANSSIGGLAQSIAGETAKTQQYLLSQRHIGRADTLAVHVLAHPLAMPAIVAACPGSETLRFAVHSHHDVADATGLDHRPGDSRADLIYLHAAAATPPSTQFAGAALRREYRLWQTAKALRLTGAAALAVSALFVAGQLLEILQLRDRTETARIAAGLADQRYRSIVNSFPPLPVGNETLRAITVTYGEMARFGISPEDLYREISRALAQAETVEIDAIEWKLSGLPEGFVAGGAAAAIPDAARAGAGKATESAIVRGTLATARDASPRDVLRIFDTFVEALRSNPQLAVTVLQQPFDVGAEKSLKSSDDGNTLLAPRPFVVTVTRKLAT